MFTRKRPRHVRLTVEHLEDRNLLAQSVTVDLTTQYQLIDGFGAGMKREVDQLYNMQEPYRTQVLNLMFNDVNTRILRTYVKASQYSTPDTGDPNVLDLNAMNFSVYAHDLWVLQQAQAIGKGKIDTFYADANTGPAWMKTNNSIIGGTLKPEDYDYYGKMFWGYLEWMKAVNGIDIGALSMFNESDQVVPYESMNPDPQQAADIFGEVGNYLHVHVPQDPQVQVPLLLAPDNSNPDSSITYLNALLANPSAAAVLDVVGSHDYGGNPSSWRTLRTLAKPRPVWMTEFSHHTSSDGIADGLVYVRKIDDVFARGGRAFVAFQWVWQADDPTAHGLIEILPNSYTVPKRYYTFKQYANTTPAESRHVAATSTTAGLRVVAYLWPDGHTASLQVLNDTSTQFANVQFNFNSLTGVVQRYRTSASLDDARLQNLVPNGNSFTDTINPMTFTTYVVTYNNDGSTTSASAGATPAGAAGFPGANLATAVPRTVADPVAAFAFHPGVSNLAAGESVVIEGSQNQPNSPATDDHGSLVKARPTSLPPKGFVAVLPGSNDDGPNSFDLLNLQGMARTNEAIR